jgi:hypothetical protein
LYFGSLYSLFYTQFNCRHKCLPNCFLLHTRTLNQWTEMSCVEISEINVFYFILFYLKSSCTPGLHGSKAWGITCFWVKKGPKLWILQTCFDYCTVTVVSKTDLLRHSFFEERGWWEQKISVNLCFMNWNQSNWSNTVEMY